MAVSSPNSENNDSNVSPNHVPNEEAPIDEGAYEVDGWQRGFDVAFHGVGRVEIVESNDDEESSDWESDESDEGDRIERPPGYSALSSEPPSSDVNNSSMIETVEETPTDTQISSREKVVSVVPSVDDFDEKTLTSIRDAVSSLKLPAPSWANDVTDSQLMQMLKEIQNK